MDARIGFVAAMLALAGCQGAAPAPAEPPPPLHPVLEVRDLMDWVLNPAAEVVWDSAGFVITADGETDLSPTSEAGWAEVRANAALVAEIGNLLMVPGRSSGPAWDVWSRALIETGTRAMDAAEAQDAEALFDAGGEVYQVCRGCHMQFWVDGSSPHITPLP